jgi:hypothetical protein
LPPPVKSAQPASVLSDITAAATNSNNYNGDNNSNMGWKQHSGEQEPDDEFTPYNFDKYVNTLSLCISV